MPEAGRRPQIQNVEIAQLDAALELLNHISGLRLAHPVLRIKLLPELYDIYQCLSEIHDTLVMHNHRSIGGDEEDPGFVLSESIRILHLLLEVAYSSTSPRHPHWLHYFLIHRLQDFTGKGHLHLLVSPISNEDTFAYYKLYSLIQDRLEMLIPVINDMYYNGNQTISLNENIPDFHVVLQTAPWFTDKLPHLIPIAMHELGHHLFEESRLINNTPQTETVYQNLHTHLSERLNNDFPGSFKSACMLHKLPLIPDEAIQFNKLIMEIGLHERLKVKYCRLLTSYIEELFCDAFAVYRLGPSLYLSFRDHILGIDEGFVSDDLKSPVLWRYDSEHPPRIVRLAFQAKLLESALPDEEVRKYLGLVSGGLFDSLKSASWSTMKETGKSALKLSIADQKRNQNWTDSLIDQEIAEQLYFLDIIIDCLDSESESPVKIVSLVENLCEAAETTAGRPLTKPLLDLETLMHTEERIKAFIPATELLMDRQYKYSHLFVVAYKLHIDSVNDQSVRNNYHNYRELVIKTVEDLGMKDLYGNAMD